MLTADAALPADPESDLLQFRRAEFTIIRRAVNDSVRIPNLRVIPSEVSDDMAPWFAKVNLVERLRETRVFYGFDRLETARQPLLEMPDSAMKQLFRNPPQQPQERWLPAIEMFGEGIYIELREDQIGRWQPDNADWLRRRLDDDFVVRLAGIFQTLPPLASANWVWASRYLLVADGESRAIGETKGRRRGLE